MHTPSVTINGVTSVDGRAAADAVGGTNLNRRDDLAIQTRPDGTQRIYFGTTDTHKVFSLTVTTPVSPSLAIFAGHGACDKRAAAGRWEEESPS